MQSSSRHTLVRRPRSLARWWGAAATLVLLMGACAPERPEPRVTLDDLLGSPDDEHAVEHDDDEFVTGQEALPDGQQAGPRAGDGAVEQPDVDRRPEGGGPSPSGDAEAEDQDTEGLETDRSREGPVAMGTGVTQETITLGFQVSEALGEGFALVGAEGDPPSEREIVAELVDWINEQGGIAGREVVPVVHGTDQTSGTWASQAQAACATFTEDNEVFAVSSSPVGGSDALLACMAEGQTPLIEQNHWWFDDVYWDRYDGWLYRPGRMRPERGLVVTVDGLAQQGYFEDATLGLVRFDAAVFDRAADETLKPRLEEHGVTIEEEAQLSTPRSVADFGQLSAQINDAILRFRAAGVDHVMMLENQGILGFFFFPQAESQGYRPTYGFNSYNIPALAASQAPSGQVENSQAIGWLPQSDIEDADHPGGNPYWDQCLEQFQNPAYPRNAFYLMAHCDSLLFLRDTLERAPELTARGLREAAHGLGDHYQSPSALATRIGAGQLDGAVAWQPMAYIEDCECFRYTGQPEAAP